jgi:ATP-binding cassette, subfamily B, bacterial
MDSILTKNLTINKTARKRENLLSLETDIGLEGNPCVERIVADGRKITVTNENREKKREWLLSEVQGFRVESAVGSSFLQASLDGRWIDVLRRPGNIDQPLMALVNKLNARCVSLRQSEESGRTRPPEFAESPDNSSGDGEMRQARPLRSTMQVLSLLRPFRGSVILLFALSLGVVSIELVPPVLQGVLVDKVLKIDMPSTSKGQLLYFLLAIVAGLLFVRLTSTLVNIWKGVVSSRVGTTMTANLRNELVEKLNAVPLAFHDRNQVGMLMSQVAYDTETLHTFVYHMTSGFILQSLQLAGIGLMMAYYNAKLAMFALLPMPLIIAGSWYFTRSLQPRYHHYWEAVGKQAAALKGMLSGIRVVKAFVQEDREIKRFCQSSRRLRDSRMAVDVSTSTFTAFMGFIFALGTLSVWYIGGRDVLFGNMSLGSLMAFLAYVAMFYTPLTSIAESTAWFANFFSINRRICDLLNVPGEPEAAQTVSLDRSQGRVEFQNVSFSYDKTRPVLKDISFTIEPREMVGVVGRSGSGKSTLVSLIGRLYQADSGSILIDGIDVKQIDRRQLRRQIGMAPQEPFLFCGTVAENITYGNSSATPEQILLAAKQSNAHDFIVRMPFAYETQLGEGGTGLSGGERQRLSIARALLFDPAILILDEATASVDAEAERAICDALRNESRRRTTILISHRLTTLKDADRLLVFDNGRLIEQGTPRKLLAQDGLYASLARIQWNMKKSRRLVNANAGVGGSFNGETAEEFYKDGDGNGNGNGDDIFQHSNGLDAKLDSVVSEDYDGEAEKQECAINWLDPAGVIIESDNQGILSAIIQDRRIEGIFAARAFPASYERRYISLRCQNASGRESEIGMIDALDRWPWTARQYVERSLSRRYLLRPVREIRQMSTKGNLLDMLLVTDCGTVKFQLDKPGAGRQYYGDGGLLLVDAKGNYYIIPDSDALPKHQKRLLNLYFGD